MASLLLFGCTIGLNSSLPQTSKKKVLLHFHLVFPTNLTNPLPQHLETMNAFRGQKNVKMEDVLAVPDYKGFFEGYTRLKGAFKPYKEQAYRY